MTDELHSHFTPEFGRLFLDDLFTVLPMCVLRLDARRVLSTVPVGGVSYRCLLVGGYSDRDLDGLRCSIFEALPAVLAVQRSPGGCAAGLRPCLAVVRS